ncbi:MAG: hypothetical protein Fur0036_05060 [Fimbriimonadaceae bacterium]
MQDIFLRERIHRLRQRVVAKEADRLARRAELNGGSMHVDLTGLSSTMVAEIQAELRARGWRFAAKRGGRFRMVWMPALPQAEAA